jgi:hypothetical protein
MKISYKSVEARSDSLDPELYFSFQIDELDINHVPGIIEGELYSEDGYKIGNLVSPASSSYRLHFQAGGATEAKAFHPITFQLTCQLNQKAVQHIEHYRHEKNNELKDIILKIELNISMFEGNMDIAHLYLGEQPSGANNRVPVSYQFSQHYRADRENMWLLSGKGGPRVFDFNRYKYPSFLISIDMMTWNKCFADYLGIGRFIVYEFLQPQQFTTDSALQKRYEKALRSLTDMKKQMQYGEWKQAVIASRPVIELFKNFSEFQNLLINAGYNIAAFEDLKKSIQAFFDYISKFHHGLAKNNEDINEEISVHQEDAYLVYSYCTSLLNLISCKFRRG